MACASFAKLNAASSQWIGQRSFAQRPESSTHLATSQVSVPIRASSCTEELVKTTVSLSLHPLLLVRNQVARERCEFYNSAKRMSKSQIGCGKDGGRLARVRCGGLAQDDGVDSEEKDKFYMRKCVELAAKATGFTSPNPMVGCVIVKDGKIVGQGFHPKAGQPHAEVFALRDAGDLAENATAYVSLEPCNHYGRTPPCTEALIKAKVKKVVIGMVDPNPIVASKGVDRLREVGIEVRFSVEEDLCRRLNEAYIHKMLTGKPFVTLRYSLSVNGQFLDQLGERVMGSGGYYSKLLQENDAIIFSSALVSGKYSIPASQESGANQPLNIIVASALNSLDQRFNLSAEDSKVIIFTDKETRVKAETAQKDTETVVLNRITLDGILEYCKQQGMCSVLVDLRGSYGDLEELLQEAVEQNMLQKIVVEVLPLWEGREGRDVMVSLTSLGKKLKLKNLQAKTSNESIVLEGYV
ncbi:riboflavin biosynthesis protein PYRD chloroplastic [Tripterygium wilfordii]|uniref:Riboflavin biosynthesis protein PYRD, chloroplastic n=1 Tax=Tripterygium wilfordii TaxID=458696 RepID=A0A7J7CCR3_TRIWF|nr:riboflavin biosynthesis protein PYRD, chloroplastic [Tripterygium wilfordii]KAF5731725.1 riboflavin biosynthesis protein PYRD chloroplastic [Tripterygium wilfordii]